MGAEVFYLHEDDWGMLDIVPAENRFESAAVAKEAEAHAEAHRAPGGVGWTGMYVIPPPRVSLAERKLALDDLRSLLGPDWRPVARVESGYSSYREECRSAFALTDDVHWFYGTIEDGRITQLCLRKESASLLGVLVSLGRTRRLILNDWWQNVIVDLSDMESVRSWLARE